MNLLIQNDVELATAIRNLKDVQQIVALAVRLGRQPREMARAAQRLEIMDVLKVDESTALLIQRSGFVSLASLSRAESADWLITCVKLAVDAAGQDLPPVREITHWFSAAKAVRPESITFKNSRTRAKDPFSEDSPRRFERPILRHSGSKFDDVGGSPLYSRETPQRPFGQILARTAVRPIFPEIVDECEGLVKPEAMSVSPESIDLMISGMLEVSFDRTTRIKVEGKHLDESYKWVSLTAVNEDHTERTHVSSKFFYSDELPIINYDLSEPFGPPQWVEFKFPDDLAPVPGLYRINVLNNYNKKCQSNPVYLRFIPPYAVRMIVARIFNLHVVEDIDGFGRGTGEGTWVFGGGTTPQRVMTGVLPGHKHLSIRDNENIGENLFPCFSIPVFDEKLDRMSSQLLLIFGALEQDGGEWLGPVLAVIGAGIGAYFGGAGGASAGGTIGERVGSALAGKGDSYGAVVIPWDQQQDNWGIQRGLLFDRLRSAWLSSQLARVDYAIQVVAAPVLVMWKVIFKTIELIDFGGGDEQEDIDVWYRVHPSYQYQSSLQMGPSSKKFFTERDENLPYTLCMKKGPSGSSGEWIEIGKTFPDTPTPIPYIYVEVIVCKDGDANIGTMATTIFTQDVFSQMFNPLVDSAAMDIQMPAYGTGGLGGSCIVKFRIEVERA